MKTSESKRSFCKTEQHHRRQTYAAINIIKKELGMDDDTYRDVMASKFGGIRSAKQLNQQQLNQWLIHLKGQQKRAGLNPDGTKHAQMINKCEALWIELRKAGKVQDGSKQALESFVRNQTGAAALRMANGKQLYQAIEILKSWLAR